MDEICSKSTAVDRSLEASRRATELVGDAISSDAAALKAWQKSLLLDNEEIISSVRCIKFKSVPDIPDDVTGKGFMMLTRLAPPK